MMLAISFLSRANANWAAPAFVSATVLVVAWALGRGWRNLVVFSIALHLAAAAVLFRGVHRFEKVARPPGTALRLIAHGSAAFDIRSVRRQSGGGQMRPQPRFPAAGDGARKRLKGCQTWSTLMAIKFGRPLERGLTRFEADTRGPAERLDLAVRPRRNRRAEWARRLVR